MTKLIGLAIILALTTSNVAETQTVHDTLKLHALAAQALSSSTVLDRIVVRHLHDNGWTSHPVELLLTSDRLLIHANQEYRDNNGYTRYCTFPAEIPLEHIVSIEAKLGTTAFWGIYKITKLDLQYIDEKGKQHEYDFLSQSAIQTNAQWSEGVGRSADLRQFAQFCPKGDKRSYRRIKAPSPETIHSQPQKTQIQCAHDWEVGTLTGDSFDSAGISSEPFTLLGREAMPRTIFLLMKS